MQWAAGVCGVSRQGGGRGHQETHHFFLVVYCSHSAALSLYCSTACVVGALVRP